MDPYDFYPMHQDIMKLTPEKAFDLVITHPFPKELVQSLPDESFYFFINNMGIDQAGPIIALATEKQWEYFIDIEIWDKELLNYFSLTKLLILMTRVASRRFSRWCFYKKINLIELYLFRNIKIEILSSDDDISDLDDNFFTYDGVFYINFINYSTKFNNEITFLQERNVAIKEMFLWFAEMDHIRYQNMLLEVINVLPYEIEEELLRLKNVRLAEKGFLPFHEAIGIYQPVKIRDIKKNGKKILKPLSSKEIYTETNIKLSLLPVNLSSRENLFTTALKNICKKSILQELRIELGALCNLVISADNKKIKNYTDLKAVVNKVNDFLNIGIESILLNNLAGEPLIPEEIVQAFSFSDLFKLGYSQTLNLNKKVKSWYNNAWFSTQKLKLYFWGENWYGVLGGLFLDKPMFFDKNTLTYRNFREYSEIIETSKIVNQIINIDNMFNHFNLDLAMIRSRYIATVKNSILTMWFSKVAKINIKNGLLQPIPWEKFKFLYDDLWDESKDKRYIKNTKKYDMLIWVAYKMNIKVDELPKNLKNFLNLLFQELEGEMSNILTKDLDPRYIKLFIIA